jgi:hypothetical protein
MLYAYSWLTVSYWVSLNVKYPTSVLHKWFEPKNNLDDGRKDYEILYVITDFHFDAVLMWALLKYMYIWQMPFVLKAIDIDNWS